MAYIIQQRRDSSANWSLANPTPKQGEICIELDTKLVKVGDGVNNWSALPYFGSVISGTIDHGILSGLNDDDHPQYLNITRGDSRYYTESEIDTILTDYYNESTLNINNIVYTHTHTTVSGGLTFSTISPTFSISPLFANNVIWLARNSSGGVEDCFWARASNNNTYLNYGSGGYFYIRDNSGATQYSFSNTAANFYDSSLTTTSTITANKFIGDGIDITNVNRGTYYAISDTLSTTTSTSWQQKLRLTTPSISAGTYRIGWYYEWYYTSTNRSFQAQVQIDDTTTLMSHVEEPTDVATSQSRPKGGFGYVTLTAGIHNIDLDFMSGNAADTAGIQRVRLEFWRIQ